MNESATRNLTFNWSGIAFRRLVISIGGIISVIMAFCMIFYVSGHSATESRIMFGLIITLAVPVMIIRGLFQVYQQWNLLRNGIKVEGEVIDLNFMWGQATGDYRPWGYHPHIKFEYKGKTHWVEAHNVYSKKNDLTKGSRVMVFVNPQNSQSCLVYDQVLFYVNGSCAS
jgi:hypothetical protein